MSASTFNPLAAARDLKAAGIEPEHAEAIAEGMRQAVTADHDELATKGDLAELRAVTKADLAAVRVEIRIIGAIVLAMAAKMFGIFNAVAGVLS